MIIYFLILKSATNFISLGSYRVEREKNRHLFLKVIVWVTSGDEDTIKKSLGFYDGYISKLSSQLMYDVCGNV